MDVISNWRNMNRRMQTEMPDILEDLTQIHAGVFDDLRRSGSLLAISGETVTQRIKGKSEEEQLKIAGDIGRYLVVFSPGEGMGIYDMDVADADAFPNCVFMGMAAILENFNGRVRNKLKVTLYYKSDSRKGDPLGQLLPVLESCFPFVELSVEREEYGPDKKEPVKLDLESVDVLFRSTNMSKVDPMRIVLRGDLLRGTVKTGDKLRLSDPEGRLLFKDAEILKIFGDGGDGIKSRQLEEADTGSGALELVVGAELHRGKYDALILSARHKEEKKKGFFARLFG